MYPTLDCGHLSWSDGSGDTRAALCQGYKGHTHCTPQGVATEPSLGSPSPGSTRVRGQKYGGQYFFWLEKKVINNHEGGKKQVSKNKKERKKLEAFQQHCQKSIKSEVNKIMGTAWIAKGK